jgi:hypothetical protein
VNKKQNKLKSKIDNLIKEKEVSVKNADSIQIKLDECQKVSSYIYVYLYL